MKGKAVDFATLVKEVQQPRYGRSDLSIWGGRCKEEDLLTFLQGWPLETIPYRIWEYVSEIEFDRDTLPNNPVLLERGRLFGEGGDLEIRRDGNTFLWRFIGPAGVRPPEGPYDARDFWATHSEEQTHRQEEVRFHRREESVLLWGKFEPEKGRWEESRVGAARLEYPAAGERIRLRYYAFSRAGRVEFVWFTGLEDDKEDSK